MGEGRQGILSAARSHFSEVGAGGFTMREVARRGGVTAAAIYHHFDGREELLREVLRLGFAEFETRMERALTREAPRDRLLATAEAYIDFAMDHPRDYEVMFMRPDVPGARRFPTDFAAGRSPAFQVVVGRVHECMAAGVLREADPIRTALLLWATVHGLVSLYLVGRFDGADFRSLALERMDALVDALGRGVRAPAGGDAAEPPAGPERTS